jgi:hypothetical protein
LQPSQAECGLTKRARNTTTPNREGGKGSYLLCTAVPWTCVQKRVKRIHHCP